MKFQASPTQEDSPLPYASLRVTNFKFTLKHGFSLEPSRPSGSLNVYPQRPCSTRIVSYSSRKSTRSRTS